MNASLGMYRRLAMGFVVLVASVLGVVLYVSLVKATIRVVPVEETVSAEVLLDVVGTPTRAQEIGGKAVSGRISRSADAVPSGEGGKEVDGIAKGTVVIRNTSQKSQALVVNTRLLTDSGILFRIDKGVDVPAGGSVEVAAHADQPGKTGDIGPSHFTIPGLSTPLQAVIYADSAAPFTGGVSTVSVVSQNDIDRAYADLRTALENDAKGMLRTQVGDGYAGESFSSTVVEQSSTVEAGSEASAFQVTMTLDVTGVFFDKDAAQTLVERALYAKLPAGKEFSKVNTDSIQVTVEKADPATGSANVRVYEDGIATASIAGASLLPSRFVGMKESEVEQLLVSEGIAKDVSIDFFPAWIRTVPRLKDHVSVEIE